MDINFGMSESLGWLIIMMMGLISTLTDIKKRVIPNWLTAGGFVAGVIVHIPAFSLQWLGGVLVWGAASFLVWRLNMFGGGDSKFFIACASVMGGTWTLIFLMYSAISSLPLLLFYMVREQRWRIRIPYAPAMFAAAVWLFIRNIAV